MSTGSSASVSSRVTSGGRSSTPGIVRVGLVQHACTADPAENTARAVAAIREAASRGADVVCLQELFRSLYFCDVEDYDRFALAETIPGPGTDELARVAGEAGIVLIASLFERRMSGVYHNTAAVFDADGSALGIYRKMHIPDDPGYFEKFYFTPGDLGYRAFDTRVGRIGVLVCWDQWYPEAARITALHGAEILFYPTAIGWALSQSDEVNREQFDAWRTIQRSHAVANGVHVVSVNRVGVEGGMRFWGGSFVASPMGAVLHQCAHDAEDIAVVEIDTRTTDSTRVHWPFLRDRRIDSYAPVLKRAIDDSTPA